MRAAAAMTRTRGFAGVVGLLERLGGSSDVFAVLTYHRVAEPDGDPTLDPALVSATPAEFEEQIAFLTGARPLVSLEDLLAVRRGERALPGGAVMLTFDDAYRDFAETAWPILRRYGAPATLFVATGYPDRPELAFWWDRLHAALATTDRSDELATPAGPLSLATDRDRRRAMSALRAHLTSVPHATAMSAVDELVTELSPSLADRTPSVLSWPELRALHSEGVALAPHSRTHPRLDRIPLEQAHTEIVGSRADLEREIGTAPPVFAYPGGGYTRDVVRLLEEAGFAAAFATRRGLNDLARASWLELRRINVGRRTALPLLRMQLLKRPARVLEAVVRS